MSETIRVNITISPEIHAYYKEQASRSGLSMSAYMSFVLFSHMEQKQKDQKIDK